jgi:enoyl-CoA hydratase/carnithine racemase
MDKFEGKTISWELIDGCMELALDRPPCNEIGTDTLDELENFVAALNEVSEEAHALIIHSRQKSGFCAGADLRELYFRSQEVSISERVEGVRDFLKRIHRVMNAIDSSPLTTIAAVNGVTFGGGFELALVCDLIIADKMARFCFPELRLGLIPGFGGIPRLKRDLGNAVVRDLLLTGRSINASKALAVGLVSQVVSEGAGLRVARMTAAQIKKFDPATRVAAKQFIKQVPYDELDKEIDIFCDLLSRPAVEASLRKFVESTDALPYLP